MYKLIDKKFISEINSQVTIYSHDKTKARIMTIENDDPNKVFSIAFRTPPINDCGLTHILEHSVLCGSKKYPLKDPFVELLKGSLNTFLNAFTFPDKTMYPCASLNDKDFQNLMSVYLDAVFHPNIYTNPYIFKQEGWHYELDDINNDITINGVVYNEMKGAFSEPMGIMARYVMHSLFKDNAYGFESGGDPKEIPNLSYDDFKNFHSKYYSPSNSYIMLYGNCNMEEKLKFIEDEYLNEFEYNDFDTNILKSKIDSFNEETHYYNVNELSDNQDYLSYNIAFDNNLDNKKIIALGIIFELLFSKPGAPIKEELIHAGIADDIDVTFETGLKQPFFSVVAINSSIEKKDEFVKIIEDGLNNAKLEYEDIQALLNFKEFKTREAAFDGPKGLGYMIRALETWLYSDKDAMLNLELLDYFKELKETDISYYNELIKNEIINNNHKSYVTLLPSMTYNKDNDDILKEKLRKYKSKLTNDELLDLINETKALKEYQMTPDTKEVINTLPTLKIDDLSSEPIKLNLEKINHEYETYYSDYFTNGIAYINWLFDISDFDIETLQYAKFLEYIYDLVNTKNHNYSELDKLEKLYTGGLSTLVRPIDKLDGNIKIYFDLKFSAMRMYFDDALELVKDTIYNSIFDSSRIKELLKEVKSNLEQAIASSGHIFAAIHAASYSSKNYYLKDQISMMGYIDFINDLIDRFDKDKDIIINNLYSVAKKIFNKNRFLSDITCDKELLDDVIKLSDKFYDSLEDNKYEFNQSFNIKNLNEMIITPYDVNYMARYSNLGMRSNGYTEVLKKVVSLEYLWQQVRVLGGAYGAMIRFGELGSLLVASYRDPNTIKTLDIFDKIPEFIRSINPSDDEMLKYKIGAMGALDDTFHVSTLGTKAFNNYICGITYDDMKKKREEIISTTLDDLKKYADIIEESFNEKFITGLVSQSSKKDCEKIFKNTRNLITK